MHDKQRSAPTPEQIHGFDSSGRYILDQFTTEEPTKDDSGYVQKSTDEVVIMRNAMYLGQPLRIVEMGYTVDEAEGTRVDTIYTGYPDGEDSVTYFRIPSDIANEAYRASRKKSTPSAIIPMEQQTRILAQSEAPVPQPSLSEMKNWALTSASAQVLDRAEHGDSIALFELQYSGAAANLTRVEEAAQIVNKAYSQAGEKPVSSQGEVFDRHVFSQIIDQLAKELEDNPDSPVQFNKVTSNGDLRKIATEIIENPACAPLRGRVSELFDLMEQREHGTEKASQPRKKTVGLLGRIGINIPKP